MSKTFAEISGNIVTNILIAETLEDAELASNLTCVEYTDENPAHIGSTYDPESNTFIVVVPEETPAAG